MAIRSTLDFDWTQSGGPMSSDSKLFTFRDFRLALVVQMVLSVFQLATI